MNSLKTQITPPPPNWLENKEISWWKHLDSKAKSTVFFALLWGFIAHGSVLFNKFSVHDDVAFTHSVGATVSSGRWVLELISRLEQFVTNGRHYSMPLLNGLCSIFLIAIAAGILVSLFRVRSYGICAAIAGIMVVNPGIASMLGYMFTAPYYSISLLMTVWGASLLCRYKKWYVYAITVMCFTCGMGIYQAYIPVAISIFLIYFIQEIYNMNEITWKRFICDACWYASAVLISVVLYYIVNKGFIKLYHEELSSYQGINKMGREGIVVYLSRVILVAQTFLFPENHEASLFCVIMGLEKPYKLLLLATAGLEVVYVCRAYKKSPLKALLLTGAFLLIPLAVNFIYVMCPDVHALMVYGSYFFFVFVGCLVDRLMTDRNRAVRLVCILCCVILLLFCCLYCRYDNALYMNVAFDQERTISYFNTLVSRIKSVEGYRDELPVAYINFVDKTDQTFYALPEFPIIRPYEKSTELINDAASKYFMDKWCGFRPTEVPFEHPDIEAMPCYPDDGSIKIIEDVIVVKFR